jgi:hypothetical protein
VTTFTNSTCRRGRPALIGASAGILALSLTACGGGSSDQAASSTTSDADQTSVTQAAAAPTGGNAAHAGSIDVCSLLSPADAKAEAKQFKLASDPAAKYKLMTQKQPPPTTAYPTSACQFTIAEVTADNTGSEAIVSVSVSPAQYLDKTGTKINGLGDEAYDEGDYVEVRSGDVVLQSNSNQGASKDFINAMYQAMIPHLA